MVTQAEVDELLGTDQEKQRSSALFLLKLKESKQVSQVVIDELVTGWNSLFSHTTLRIQAGVRASLANAGIDLNDVPGLDDVFRELPMPFDGIETRFKQEKYYRESLHLVVRYLVCLGLRRNYVNDSYILYSYDHTMQLSLNLSFRNLKKEN